MIKVFFSRDLFHIPIITVLIYLGTYYFESGFSMVHGIPKSAISIGMQTIIDDMALAMVISLPLIILMVALTKKAVSDNVSLIISIVMSVIYIAYITRGSRTPSYVTVIILACFIMCIYEIKMRVTGNVGNLRFLPDFICCFIFLLCFCFISSVIGQASYNLKIKELISIKNKNYLLLRMYGDNIFISDDHGKTIWVRTDNPEFNIEIKNN